MGATEPVNFSGLTGAGLYGGPPEPYRGHKCGNCNWQGRGREDCPNNRRHSLPKPAVEPAELHEFFGYGADDAEVL